MDCWTVPTLCVGMPPRRSASQPPRTGGSFGLRYLRGCVESGVDSVFPFPASGGRVWPVLPARPLQSQTGCRGAPGAPFPRSTGGGSYLAALLPTRVRRNRTRVPPNGKRVTMPDSLGDGHAMIWRPIISGAWFGGSPIGIRPTAGLSFRDAGLSSLSGAWRHVFLHRQRVGTAAGSVGSPRRCITTGGARYTKGSTVSRRRLGMLPDHMHCMWTLPPGDDDFSNRWKAIKIRFVRAIPRSERRSQVRIAGRGATALPGACHTQRSRLCPPC